MEKKIGSIQQGVPAYELESALLAWLDNEFTQEYSLELASHLTTGKARKKKISTTINNLILRNPISEFVKLHEHEVRVLLRDNNSRSLVLTAIVSAAYPFVYDVLMIMGKYFHAQDVITKDLIRQKVSSIYGSNRSLDIALFAVLPMLIDFGFITMPKPGVYNIVYQENYAALALDFYKESYVINNSTFILGDDLSGNPYFEFINN
jgi:hypothetical protein